MFTKFPSQACLLVGVMRCSSSHPFHFPNLEPDWFFVYTVPLVIPLISQLPVLDCASYRKRTHVSISGFVSSIPVPVSYAETFLIDVLIDDGGDGGKDRQVTDTVPERIIDLAASGAISVGKWSCGLHPDLATYWLDDFGQVF